MYVKVLVTAGAKRESIVERDPTHFLLSVREKAERNAANERVREILASRFSVPVAQVRIVNGHQSPSKLLSIEPLH